MPSSRSRGYHADSQTMDVAVREQDAEVLEHIVVSMFDFHLDYQQAPQLRGVRDEYIDMAKENLAAGKVSRLSCATTIRADTQFASTAQLIRSLVESRQVQPSVEALSAVRCPLLVLSVSPLPAFKWSVLIPSRKVQTIHQSLTNLPT
jgi:hypothetical protein